jgi:hypothetical protein
MQGNSLVEAVKSGDITAVEKSLLSGTDINESGEQGWTPLNHAAGKGDLKMVKLLVARGADIFKTGHDNRTAYMIALAAGRAEVAKYLREVVDAVGPEEAKLLRPRRSYCKAYLLKDLRQFTSWSESKINWKDHENGREASGADGEVADDDRVVFIHQDFTVTHSMWRDENVIFNQVSPKWQEFCVNTLKFKAPTDLDLIDTSGAAL